MDIYVLDTNFNTIGIIDDYVSLVWNERYYQPGDFELNVPISSLGIPYLAMDNYLYIEKSKKMMIIETYEPNTDYEDGNVIKYSGRSLESILDRRIVWQQTVISGNFQNAIKKLINDAIIYPEDSDRAIENFYFMNSTNSDITSLTIDSTQFTGDNLLDVVQSLCLNKKVGFQINLNSINVSNNFVEDTEMPYRFFCGSVVVLNNEIHILGGGYEYTMKYHYKYNGSVWTSVSTLPYNFFQGSAVVLNNEIHILGGLDSPKRHYKWNGSSWVNATPYIWNGSKWV